jgi:very-short-patch-repair endonuclease
VKSYAQDLRNNATKPERVLWNRLRRPQLGGLKFRRQHPIGRYVCDFVCLEAAVVGVPDTRLGEVGRAYVVRRDPALGADDVIDFAKERLANFKVPREVEFLDVLPRNVSGKVLKTELRSESTGDQDGA